MFDTDRIMNMPAHELRTKLIGAETLLSALSQLSWREADKYNIEDFDKIRKLLRPYHPDPAVSSNESGTD